MLPSKPDLKVPDVFLMMPDHAKGIIRFYHDVMRGPSKLTPGERELIYSYAVALQGCHYPYHSHMAAAIELGIDSKLPNSLFDDFDNAPIDSRLRAILTYARKLALAPGALEESDSAAFYAAGREESELFDIVRVCALAGWISRMVAGLGATGDKEFMRERGKVLASEGYEGILSKLTAHFEEANP